MITYRPGQHLKCINKFNDEIMVVGKVYTISRLDGNVIRLVSGTPPEYGWSTVLANNWFEVVGCPCAINNCLKHRIENKSL